MITATDLVARLHQEGFNARIVTDNLVQVWHDGYVSNIKPTNDFGKERWGCNVVYIEQLLLRW